MTQAISPLSQTDLDAAEGMVRRALADLQEEWGRDDLGGASPDTDLFEQIDSFAIVDLLLRTEAEVENAIGRYVPLADEKVLDAGSSPLRSVSDWIAYVAGAIANG